MKGVLYLFLSFLILLVLPTCKSTADKVLDNHTLELSVIGTYETGIYDESAAEIVDYDEATKRLFFVNAHSSAVEILDIADPANPRKIKDVKFERGSANSVSVKNGLVAVAVEDSIKQNPGEVIFVDTDGAIVNRVQVGALPDMVTFTPDGKFVVVANEGEPNADYSVDPDGSVSIIDVSSGVENLTADDVYTVAFSRDKFVGDVRISGPEGTSVAQDMEPEYIAVSEDSRYAFVICQENNAVAKIDINKKELVSVTGFGLKDFSKPGAGLDAIKDKAINIANYPVFGMYMPDAVASYTVGGKTYIVTANEGDGREYGDEDDPNYTDEIKVKKLKLDEAAFAGKEGVLSEIESLKAVAGTGDTDGDGDVDRIQIFGARSFSIWTDDAKLVFDSGDQFEQITAQRYPEFFNASNSKDKFDDRSKSKGPEPEGVAIGKIGKKHYAFILLERIGGVMVYDVTKPSDAKFVQYINNREFGPLNDKEFSKAKDLGPEGVKFIDAAKSPTGEPLLVVANEVSGTVTLYDVVK